MPDEYITCKDAAELLSVSTNVLDLWRHRRTGPAWYAFGRNIRYYRPDVLAFRDACRRDPASTPSADLSLKG